MSAALLLLALAAPPPVEVQLGLQSLRAGERARLEKAVGPVASLPLYRVELTVEPIRRRVSGQLSLTTPVARGQEELAFRLTPNAAHPGAVSITSATVNGTPAPPATVEPTLVTVPLPRGVSPVTVILTVEATVPELTGTPGDYGAFSASPHILNLSGLVPMLAPPGPGGAYAPGPGPVGDLGTFAPSAFVAAIIAPQGWEVVTPGVRTGRVAQRSGVRFTSAVVGARELPMLVLKDPVKTTATAGDVTVECWSRARGKSGVASRVLSHATEALAALEQRLGPYPYTTFRVVEVPLVNGAGGMEFPGLITVSTMLMEGTGNPLAALGMGGLGTSADLEALLGEAGMGSTLTDLFETVLEFTVAHEVAHQYTGILVGNDPVLHPVVDEALTQHLALLVLEWRHGAAAARQLRTMQLEGSYQLHRAMGGSDGAADRPTFEFESNVEYAALVYGKAPLLFDAWRKALGDGPWLATLRTYVEENRYRTVTRDALLDAARRRSGGNGGALAGLMRRWWDEKHGDEDVGTMPDLAGIMGGGADDAAARNRLEQLDALMEQLEALTGP